MLNEYRSDENVAAFIEVACRVSDQKRQMKHPGRDEIGGSEIEFQGDGDHRQRKRGLVSRQHPSIRLGGMHEERNEIPGHRRDDDQRLRAASERRKHA